MSSPGPASGPRRRTVVRSAAWTVPVVSTVAAAPAFAASPCQTFYDGTVSFAANGNYTRQSLSAGSAPVMLSGAGGQVDVTFSSAVTGAYNLNSANLQKNALVANELQLYQQRISGSTNATSSANQTLTIRFGRPVYDLVLPIDGFTNTGAAYVDTASVSPAPTSSTNGANVVGTGTTGNPFKPTGTANGSGASVTTTLTYAGPASEVQIVYWDSDPDSSTSAQAIYLKNLTFRAKQVGC